MTAKPVAKPAAESALKAEVKKVDPAAKADPDYLKISQAKETAVTSAEEDFIRSLLEEVDFLTHKEKKDQTTSAQQQSQKIIQQLKNAPSSINPTENSLIGILGPCALKGHIVHFYNLQFEIERHIRYVDQLEDPRFVEAYHFLKANPSVEAVFVYAHTMKAYYRIGNKVMAKIF